MALPVPNVPVAPGIPPVPRNVLIVEQAVELLVADAVILTGLQFIPQQWGLYLNGILALEPDSIVSFDFEQEWKIADYPLEEGAFETYDKVITPFRVGLRMSIGGSVFDRQAFLADLAAIAGDTNLYDVYTPEQIYQSVNIERFRISRTARSGLGLLVVDVLVQQVNVSATGAYQQVTGATITNPASPNYTTSISGGPVTPQATNASMAAALKDCIG